MWTPGVVDARLGFDAEFCPDPIPKQIYGVRVEWCEVYAGGSSAANPWNDVALFRVQDAGLRILPVWRKSIDAGQEL